MDTTTNDLIELKSSHYPINDNNGVNIKSNNV
jgi:hypothetical protein